MTEVFPPASKAAEDFESKDISCPIADEINDVQQLESPVSGCHPSHPEVNNLLRYRHYIFNDSNRALETLTHFSSCIIQAATLHSSPSYDKNQRRGSREPPLCRRRSSWSLTQVRMGNAVWVSMDSNPGPRPSDLASRMRKGYNMSAPGNGLCRRPLTEPAFE